jgi:hypothetical protein
LIEHSTNGTTWAQVSGPVGGGDAGLNGITAVAANDVWAVGMDILHGT